MGRKKLTSSFFNEIGPSRFEPNGIARGPWDADACHAGPVAALLARASETLLPDKQLVRLTVDIARPIPMAGFRIAGEVVREGRAAGVTAARLLDGDNKLCATSEGLHLAIGDIGPAPTPANPPPPFDTARAGRFPVGVSNHGLEFFADGVETAYPPGEDAEPGPTTIWMRSASIIAGEVASPFQRLCPLADCGNGTSRNAELDEFTFVNPDLTVTMHRPPRGEWIASRAVSHWEATGIGLARALLYDRQGLVGTATQTLLITST